MYVHKYLWYNKYIITYKTDKNSIQHFDNASKSTIKCRVLGSASTHILDNLHLNPRPDNSQISQSRVSVQRLSYMYILASQMII